MSERERVQKLNQSPNLSLFSYSLIRLASLLYYSQAPSHLDRLRSWGYTFVRFLLTWESISHNGPHPDQIDKDYLDYLEHLMKLFNQFEFKVVVCAHQDCWSRLSGGSGAPGWVSLLFENDKQRRQIGGERERGTRNQNKQPNCGLSYLVLLTALFAIKSER